MIIFIIVTANVWPIPYLSPMLTGVQEVLRFCFRNLKVCNVGITGVMNYKEIRCLDIHI
jgi:hypothetical protein